MNFPSRYYSKSIALFK